MTETEGKSVSTTGARTATLVGRECELVATRTSIHAGMCFRPGWESRNLDDREVGHSGSSPAASWLVSRRSTRRPRPRRLTANWEHEGRDDEGCRAAAYVADALGWGDAVTIVQG